MTGNGAGMEIPFSGDKLSLADPLVCRRNYGAAMTGGITETNEQWHQARFPLEAV